MNLDFVSLEALRTHHPAWRLLASPHAALVASFLQRVFVAANARSVAAADLVEALEDDLFGLRERLGEDAFPRSAADYLDEWAAPTKGWLRKFYRNDSDQPFFELTPSTEKAIAWLAGLGERSFVGTESRMRTLFELLRQIAEGSDADPARRLAELSRRREAIDQEIARVQAGDILLLDAVEVKDRFQQFQQLARELLADFREVEQNFRLLDRRVRERIALWDGGKGALLEQVMGERDAIANSDQGRSFRAFWEFLMSSRRQEELSEWLDQVLLLQPVLELKPDPRTRRVHHDWLEAGEHTQRTVAQLSQQLRHFLDDQAWLENRRIIELLRGIEARALALRATPPEALSLSLPGASVDIELPMERPLYRVAQRQALRDVAVEAAADELDAAALYAHLVVDKAALARDIRRALQQCSQISLGELVAARPLQHGLAELVTYLQLASESFGGLVDESSTETVRWQVAGDGGGGIRQARLPRVLFVR